MFIATGGEAAVVARDTVVRCHREDSRRCSFCIPCLYLANGFRGFNAVHSWHVHVHEDQIERPWFGRFDRLDAVLCEV